MSIEAKTFINLVLVVLMGSVTTLPSTGGHADPSNRARISEEAFAPDANKAEPVSADWATTVEEAVRDILANMSAEEKTKIREAKRENLGQLHLTWGVAIRNRYGLWGGNRKLMLSACGRPCHPDDASMKITEAVWDELHR